MTSATETAQAADVLPPTIDEAGVAVIRQHLDHFNPFDVFALERDPIAAWKYVLLEMRGITRWQRHALLRTIIAVRIAQHGRYDQARGEALLAEVLDGLYDQP